MKVELSKTEIKTICNTLDTAAKGCHRILSQDYGCFIAASQMRILQWAQMYETLSEKLKIASAGEEDELEFLEAESAVTEKDILNCFGRRG